MVLCASALAQLAPDRLYNGINREIPINVTVPTGKEGEAVIELLRPVSAEKVATASVLPGKVNLATLFPNLWNTKTPSLLYAQLSVGGAKVGPALVLQPMVSPKQASIQPGSREPKFSSTGETYTGLRIYVDKYVRFDTDKGVIEFQLRPDVAPNTVVRLSSGTYHVVSTYGSVNAVIRSDIRVDPGKLTEATVEHKAAELTMKLVREEGGEAIADTSWSILSASGDPIREVVGAYASLVLAEGDYTFIAKNRDRIYQRDYSVVGGRNQEVEVLANEANSADAIEGAD